MVFLGRVEGGVGPDLGDYGFVAEQARGGQALLGGLGDLALLIVVIEDRRAVLRTAIHELTAAVGGVDVPPEVLHQVLVGDLLGVEEDLHRLQVMGLAGGVLGVGGVDLAAAGEAGIDPGDARRLLEIRLGAPEATAGKEGGGT